MKKEKKKREKKKSLVDKYYELNVVNDKPEFQVLMEKYEVYNSLKKTHEIVNINLDNSTQTLINK